MTLYRVKNHVDISSGPMVANSNFLGRRCTIAAVSPFVLFFFITCQQPILNSETLFDLVKLHTSYFVTFISILVSFEKLLHREKKLYIQDWM